MPKIPKEKTGLAATPHGKAVRVYVLVEQYLKSERFSALSPTSKKNYLSALKSIEDMKMPNNRSMLEDYAHKVTYQTADYIKRILGYTLAPASVALRFAILSGIWDLAIRNGQLSVNVWEKSRIRLDNLREIVWTTDQINKVIDVAKSEGYDLLALYVQMAYSTGQRPFSDLRELKWENLKQDKDRWILDFIIAKTSQKILLPLDNSIANVLCNMPRVSEYIFTDSKGRRLTSGGITRQLNRVKFRLGFKDLTMRDLRRTAVTEMAQAGATLSEITAATGWKSPDRVIGRYAIMRLNTADNCMTKRKAFQDANTLSESSTVLQ